ncbi:MAG TPA: hypothetical protein VIJ22_19555 [Polyangiaceae bacterium]
MTTQDSDSEITGKVAASLTPPVARLHVPRGEQSSGFFDLHTLYTMHVQPTQRAAPPPLPAPPLPALLPVLPRRDLPQPRSREALAPSPATRARPQPIGWYAVFVTWLATLTLATLSATQLPAHVATHARPPAPAPTLTPALTLTLTPALTPAPTPSSGPPTIALSDLPRVAPAPARTAPRHLHAIVHPPPEPFLTPTSVSPPSPAPAPAPSPAPASTTNMSLDDLIRHEVAAEQKRLHPAAKP